MLQAGRETARAPRPVGRAAHKALVYGAVQGRVDLSPVAVAGAAEFARAVFDDAERQDFCGDAVITAELPDWLPPLEAWLPRDALASMGLRVADGARDEIVATIGVEMHEDDINGMTLCLVLHNDGLTFRQGRRGYRPAAGEWFVFDDRLPHGVRECRGRSALVAWTVPLEAEMGNR